MYPNLMEEMRRLNVRKRDICRELKMDERTLRNRLDGSTPFKIPEAFAIQKRFFPGASIEYLFGE